LTLTKSCSPNALQPGPVPSRNALGRPAPAGSSAPASVSSPTIPTTIRPNAAVRIHTAFQNENQKPGRCGPPMAPSRACAGPSAALFYGRSLIRVNILRPRAAPRRSRSGKSRRCLRTTILGCHPCQTPRRGSPRAPSPRVGLDGLPSWILRWSAELGINLTPRNDLLSWKLGSSLTQRPVTAFGRRGSCGAGQREPGKGATT
jgi:hypothetical protein